MADTPVVPTGVLAIIKNLNLVARAQYHPANDKPSGAQPTFHEKSFIRLKELASQIVRTLGINPSPNKDQRENLDASFKELEKLTNSYAKYTNMSGDVAAPVMNALAEWDLLRA